MQIVSYVIATLIPLIALYVIYTLDLYKLGTFKSVLTCFVAGSVAFFIAREVNLFLYTGKYVDYHTTVRYSAPIIEEILKGLILIYLVRRPSFTYFVDGAIYGFASGIGFAIFENYEYIASSYDAGLITALSRVLSTNLIHASASALLGIGFGLSRFQRSYRKILVIALGLVSAIGLHMIYNNVVDRVDSGVISESMILLAATVIGFSGAGLVALIMNRGLKEEKTWIEEKLGAADRVTSGEAAIVKRFDEMNDLLAPLTQRFGEEKAAKIERFLTIQARLGIQRKTLDKLTDKKMHQAVEKQMAELRQEMDKARREVGSYAMLYLRHTIPADASPLWNRLENLIQERAAARPASGGMNLWSNLDTKARQQTGDKPNPFGTPKPPATGQKPE